MSGHLRGNLCLLVLTVLLCSVLYPLVLLGIGQTFFRHQAEGSLLDEQGNPVTDATKARGSLLIAQPFKGPEYFQPRPSNAGSNGYDAAASGASNWGASNPLLRSRVARQLGPIVKYAGNSPTKPGQRVAGDVETWFQTQVRKDPGLVARWAYDPLKKKVTVLAEQWTKDNSEAVGRWLKTSKEEVEKEPGESARVFFAEFVQKHPGSWPAVADGKIQPVQEGSDVQAYFFDQWLQANKQAIAEGTIVLEKVPADMVMSSGSGLDPHITLKNAEYQLRNGVAEKQAQKILKLLQATPAAIEVRFGKPLEQRVLDETEKLLQKQKQAPLGGLAGVDLVNVLELNLALDAQREQLIQELK